MKLGDEWSRPSDPTDALPEELRKDALRRRRLVKVSDVGVLVLVVVLVVIAIAIFGAVDADCTSRGGTLVRGVFTFKCIGGAP